jgi:hypothetical protein
VRARAYVFTGMGSLFEAMQRGEPVLATSTPDVLLTSLVPEPLPASTLPTPVRSFLAPVDLYRFYFVFPV